MIIAVKRIKKHTKGTAFFGAVLFCVLKAPKRKNTLTCNQVKVLRVELLSRFELETSSLPRMRSTN